MTITVYSKPNCPRCDATTRLLDRLDAEYTVIDVSTDTEARDYVLSLGYQEAPVVVAGQHHWSGYRQARVRDAVAAQL